MLYTLQGGVVRKIKNGVIGTGLSLMLVASSLGGSLPLLWQSSASAAPGLVYDPAGFDSLTLTPDRRAPSGGWTNGTDSLVMNIDNTQASSTAGFTRTEGLKSAIPVSRAVSASLLVDSNWNGKPVRAGLWAGASSGTAGALAYPIIEYTTVGGFTGWRVYDTLGIGNWVNLTGVAANPGETYTLEIAYNAATENYDYFVNNVKVASTTAADGSTVYSNLQEVIFNSFNSATTSADNYSASWSGFRTAQAPTTEACTTTGSVRTTDMSSWDLSQTRSAGHNRLLAEGLNLYTDTGATGSPDPRKAAGYYPTNFALSETGSQTIAQSIDYEVTTGVGPGLQLSVDFDNDGSFDGYLVGETVYNNVWWLPDSDSKQFVKDGAPANAAGTGSAWDGTLNEWLSAYPDAQVQAIGYSLGSGVNASGVLKRITLGCADYTFGLATPALLSPSNGAVVNGASVTNSWSAVPDATEYQYQSYNDAAGTSLRFSGNYTTTSKSATNVADGTVFYWRVRALDVNGDTGPWSNNGDTWKLTVDNTAPTSTNDLPSLVSGTVTVKQVISDPNAASGKLRIWKLNDSGQPDNTKFYASAQMNADSNDTVTYSLNSTTLFGDGNYIAKFTSWDDAGNASVQDKNFTVDNTAPDVAITAPTANSTVDGTVTISGTVTDANPLRYYLVVKNQAGQVVGGPRTVNATTVSDYQWDTTTLADGVYTIVLEARDQADNKDGGSITQVVVTVNNATDTPTTTPPTTTPEQGQGNGNAGGSESQGNNLVSATSSNNPASATGSAANDGGDTDDDNVANFAADAGEVLGAATTTPTTISTETSDNGEVQGDSTNKEAENSSAFLGLGWWWLLILAAVALLLAALRRRNQTQN